MLSYEFCEIFKSIVFTENLRKTILKLAHDFNEITILFKSYPLVKSIIVVAVAIFT